MIPEQDREIYFICLALELKQPRNLFIIMDVLFKIVNLIRIFYNILYWLDSYCFICIYRFLYHCTYIDFYSIVWYLDSIYIILVTFIIISSIIYI